jgi:hypothetical protein
LAVSAPSYSPKCVEGVFSEVGLPLYGVLRVRPWLRPSVPLAVPPLRHGCGRPPAYNGAVGYLISAAEGQTSVKLTDAQWRTLIYLASTHGFSAPHLRLEAEDEALEVDESDAEGLRGALGKALEARGAEEIRTPDGELDYYTIQRVRHVLLSKGVRLARPRVEG